MITIGRKDKVDLPGLELNNIEAKIDTGAYGCTLHCHSIGLVMRNGKEILAFKVLDPSHSLYEDKVFYFEEFSDKLVKNSGGETEHRYTIKTEMIVFGENKAFDFSLTNRNKMKYPILLGREFLTGRFVVDVALKDLSFKLKKTEK
ncbi:MULTISPECIES: ATP-dependent zinc protease family protein [unclassified Saccharicrinis]|uniref:ATP-dependent zinc protease family protein n=1 Tax=unclassified Saccharicrinis TaxID=2646859 RepID=UPI003D324F52